MSDLKLQQLTDWEEIWHKSLGWEPNERQKNQYQQLYEQILLGNRKLNLTRITEPKDFWEKHLWDSLIGIIGSDLFTPEDLNRSHRLIDIGTGGGFPGVPLAIAFPNWHFTLIDSTQKKIAFLETLIQNLDLKNIQTLVARAEQLAQNKSHRETYDLASIRAVAQASVCAEYTIPFIVIGGLAILYRGHWSDEDTQLLQPAVEKLGCKIESIVNLNTPLTKGIRHCIYLRKVFSTPIEYPRAVGIPNQKPL